MTTVNEIPSVPEVHAEVKVGAGETAVSAHGEQDVPEQLPSNAADPWQALAQLGNQLVSALGAASNPAAPAHPWIERDSETGAQSLKVPLPSPETARQIADALSMVANALRGQSPLP